MGSDLLKLFALYDQVEGYRKKLDKYRYSNPENFNQYAAKYSRGMKQLQIYHRLLFESPFREEFSFTYES